MSDLDPTPCTEGVLADMTALASQIKNPVPPYPVFYSGGQCGGALTGASFPLYYFPVNCQDTYNDGSSVPSASDNCLRIISDASFDPFNGGTIDANLVNVLPGGNDEKGNPKSNIFDNPDNTRLFSWYVPPQYKMVFYAQNPMTTARESAGPYLEMLPGELQVNACLSQLTLSDGSTTFFKYNGSPNCLMSSCSCVLGGQTIPQGTYCQESTTAPVCDVANAQNQHNAPYFIIIQLEEYPSIIQDMCVDNRQVSLGPSTNSLNTVWKGQAAGCDSFMTSICNTSNVTDTDFAETCKCFTQQTLLNNEFGEALDVPVCCFGYDPDDPTDKSKSCAFSADSYKTNSMLQNCCSFAECQKIVENSQQMKVNASPPGEIVCQGSFVQFPQPPSPQPSVVPNVFIDNTTSIPIYVWIILAVAVVLLLLFVLSLAFVL